MKFREEEVLATKYYKVIKLHQSIRLKSGVPPPARDNFDPVVAAKKEIQLSQIKCP